MFSLLNKLHFVNIHQDYLKYLHERCNEVYYKPIGYENKPYIGILINEENFQYVIPLSSAKEKHKTWKNVDIDRFLIYEYCSKQSLSPNAVYTKTDEETVKHILSVIDLKKMLPIKNGVYSYVDITTNPNDSKAIADYKNLMNKEFVFCHKILDSIIHKANKLYYKQIQTGKIVKFCCDFRLLEKLCSEYRV